MKCPACGKEMREVSNSVSNIANENDQILKPTRYWKCTNCGYKKVGEN